MIATWLMHALLVGSLLAISAALLEAALRARRLPTRWVWAIAMAATVALTLVGPFRSSGGEAAPLIIATAEGTAAPAARAASAGGPLAVAGRALETARSEWNRALARTRLLAGPPLVESVGRVLLIGWALCSPLLVAGYFVTTLRASRRRRRWPTAELEGVRVRVSPNLGPLVMGIVRPEIIVPRWLLASEPGERRLVLAHEREHVRTADPLILTMGWLFAAFLPWHPAAWWMLSRLRLAIETDCDARVLRGGADRATYGAVLIDVAERGTGGLVAAPALLGGSSQLERRLYMMTKRSPRFSGLRCLALLTASGVIALAACEAKVPTAAELAAMDVSAAEQRLQMVELGPDLTYFVDEVEVSSAVARALAPEQIASIRVIKRTDGSEPSSVRIATRDAADLDGSELLAVRASVPGDTDPGQRVLIRGANGDEGLVAAHAAPEQGVLIRGDNDAPVLLLVDGDRVRRIEAARLRTIGPDRIESVDVIKDSAAARAAYDSPDAENGVIRIRLRTPGHGPDAQTPEEEG